MFDHYTVSRSDYDAQVEDWVEKEPDPKWLGHVNRVGLSPGQLLIDCGCGAGKYSALLRGVGVRVIGVDREIRCIRLARQNNGGSNRFLVADLRSLPVACDCADYVLFRYVLHHLTAVSLIQVLHEAARCLRAKGKVIIETAFHEQLRMHFDHIIYPRLLQVAEEMYQSKGFLMEALESTGFILELQESIVRKKGMYVSVEAALVNSERLIRTGRGPTTWLRLNPDERVEFHTLRRAGLCNLFPSGRVPREWPGVLLLAAKNV